jgi:hypothetical protein
MSIKAAAEPPEQWPAAVDPMIAYAEWRMSCASVWTAYREWSRAPKADANLAHAAYTAALDREDAAARAYAHLAKLGAGSDRAAWTWLGRQLPYAA